MQHDTRMAALRALDVAIEAVYYQHANLAVGYLLEAVGHICRDHPGAVREVRNWLEQTALREPAGPGVQEAKHGPAR